MTGDFKYKWMRTPVLIITPERVGRQIRIEIPLALLEHDNPFSNKKITWCLERTKNAFVLKPFER